MTIKDVVYDIGGGMRRTDAGLKARHWEDADGKRKTIDTSVRRRAILDTLGKYQNVVAAGPYRAYFADDSDDYVFQNGDASTEYKFLTDPAGITVKTISTNGGIKQDYILADETAATELRWLLDTNATLNGADSNSDLSYTYNGRHAFTITKPVAWDADSKYVPVHSWVSGDTLIYRAIIPDNVIWPVTVDPTTTTITAELDGEVHFAQSTGISYSATRNQAAGNGTSLAGLVGQSEASTSWYNIRRSFYTFPIPNYTGVLLSATLNLNGNGDSSANDFDITVLGANDYGPTLATDDFNALDGWEVSGAYTGTKLTDTWNTADFSNDWNVFTFKAAGIDSIAQSKGDSLRIALISDDDYNENAPADDTNEFVGFIASDGGADAPYLSIITWVQLYNTWETIDLTSFEFQSQKATIDSSYGLARGLGGASTADPADSLGQWYDGSLLYEVIRASMSINVLPQASSISAASILVKAAGVDSLVSTGIMGFMGEWNGGDNSNTHFENFDGHETGTTALSGVSLFEPKSSLAAGVVDSFVFNANGLEALRQLLIAGGDTLRINFVVKNDSTGTAPAAKDIITFDADYIPRLRTTLALIDSIPTDFALDSISSDSLVVTWTNRTYSSDVKYLLRDASSGAAVAGTDSIDYDTTELRVGGLIVNTLYDWKLEIFNGGNDGEFSLPDSTYTWSNAIVLAPDSTYISNGNVKIVIDTTGTGNPGDTDIAVLLIDTDGDTAWYDVSGDSLRYETLLIDDSWGWRDLSSWGGANGDTLSIGVGATYDIRTQTRNHDTP